MANSGIFAEGKEGGFSCKTLFYIDLKRVSKELDKTFYCNLAKLYRVSPWAGNPPTKFNKNKLLFCLFIYIVQINFIPSIVNGNSKLPEQQK